MLRFQELDSMDLCEIEWAVESQDKGFRRHVQQLLPRPEEELNGGLTEPPTSPLAERIHQLCKLYLWGSPEQRAYIRSRIDWNQGSQLRQYSAASAALAVSAHSEGAVRWGLVALAIENLSVADPRDMLVPVSFLFHAAKRIGSDPYRLFGEVAEISGPGVAAMLLEFLSRPPEMQSIESMGWREVETPDGLGFMLGNPSPEPDA